MGDLVNQFPEKKSPQFPLTSIRFLCFLKRKIPKISSLKFIVSLIPIFSLNKIKSTISLALSNQSDPSTQVFCLYTRGRERQRQSQYRALLLFQPSTIPLLSTA